MIPVMIPEYFWVAVAASLVIVSSGVAVYLIEAGVAKIRKAGKEG